MVQVLKPDVRDRIERAALQCFAERGYAASSMATIAASAGTAVANTYRYVASKQALFTTVVPPELLVRHDALLDRRIAALADAAGATSTAATELLDFWLDHRLQVVVLLDRAEGTPYADYPSAFVDRLVERAALVLPVPPTPDERELLHVVFDNTRRAIARLLLGARDREHARASIAGFWSYQVPGLAGLLSHVAQTRQSPPREG